MEDALDKERLATGDESVIIADTITCRATRKRCVVHCTIKQGTGLVEVNNREFTEYFGFSERYETCFIIRSTTYPYFYFY
jgi:hypothetical protein